jgi:hypothetical protein
MTTTYTSSGLLAGEVKQGRGAPLKTFTPEGRRLKDTGTKIQNRIGTLVCLAILIGVLWRFWDKYAFL